MNKFRSLLTNISRHKRLALIVVIAAVIIGGVATILIAHNNTQSAKSAAKSIAEAPVVFGANRISNACNVLPASSFNQIFGYNVDTQYEFDQSFAEGTHTTSDSIGTSCAYPVAPHQKTGTDIEGNITIEVQDYKTAGAADKTQKFYESSQFNNTVVLAGTSVNFNPYGSATYSYKNKLIQLTFSGSKYGTKTSSGAQEAPTMDMSADALKGYMAKAIPVMNKNIDNQNLSQAPIDPLYKGQKLAGSTSAVIVNSCDLFTTKDFEYITGWSEDDTRISLNQSIDPRGESAKYVDRASTMGNTTCFRRAYLPGPRPFSEAAAKSLNDSVSNGDTNTDIGSLTESDSFQAYDEKTSPAVSEELDYYTSPSEAMRRTKRFYDAANSSDSLVRDGGSINEIPNLGDFAFRYNSKFGGSDSISYRIVKGAYQLQITIEYRHPYLGNGPGLQQGSDEQFMRAANTMLAKLPASQATK